MSEVIRKSKVERALEQLKVAIAVNQELSGQEPNKDYAQFLAGQATGMASAIRQVEAALAR